MCGITGVYNYKTNQLISQETLNSMTLSLSHRGPDEAKTYSDNFISFGFTRLSIIDLETGSQPMFSNSGRYILIFNGEIYNFLSLKKKLLSEGYKFKSSSDSEVILALYDLGYKNPETELEGMFAFALWDSKHQQLLLARDTMGIKPLCRTIVNDTLLFSSEFKALRAHEDASERAVHGRWLEIRGVSGSRASCSDRRDQEISCALHR